MPISNLSAVDPRDFDAGGVSIGHAAGAQVSGSGRSLGERLKAVVDKANEIAGVVNALPLTGSALATSTELTIASGVITVTQNFHRVDTEGDAASDDLDTISGGSVGQIVILRAENDARTVVVKHGAGIICPFGRDISLAEDDDYVMLVKHASSAWVVIASKITAAAGGLLGAVLALTTTGNGAALIGIEDAANLITATTVEAALLEHQNRLPTNTIADPGTGAAIPVTRSGQLVLTIGAGAETNTLANPSFAGQRLTISVGTIGAGTRAITAASAVSGATAIMTFNASTDLIVLEAVSIAGTLRWRVILNESVGLT